jgi:hypothetical protein
MPCPLHPQRDQSKYTWRRVQVMKFLVVLFSPPSCDFISLRSKYSPQHPLSNTVSLCSSLNVRDQVSNPHSCRQNCSFVYSKIYVFRYQTVGSGLNGKECYQNSISLTFLLSQILISYCYSKIFYLYHIFK